MPDDLDHRLLNGWQHGFPLSPRPFAEIARALEVGEAEVVSRFIRLLEHGLIGRIGAVVRPHAVGASTLAAMAVPEQEVERVAGLINAEQGVNHNYLRENAVNLWFVVTGADQAQVQASLKRIETDSGLPVLDLPLVRPYHLDLGFSLDPAEPRRKVALPARVEAASEADRDLLGTLGDGLPLVPRPYHKIGERLGRTEAQVLSRLGELVKAHIVSRFGVVVRHRALGWRANAMVVWRVPPAALDHFGRALAADPGVSLCYARRADLERWPYNLYCMFHAKDRAEALAALDAAERCVGLTGRPRQILFSLRCFKQGGALLAPREAA